MHPTTLSVTIRKPLFSIQLFTSYFLPNQGGKKFGLYPICMVHSTPLDVGPITISLVTKLAMVVAFLIFLFMCHQVQNLTRKCQMQIDKKVFRNNNQSLHGLGNLPHTPSLLLSILAFLTVKSLTLFTSGSCKLLRYCLPHFV